MRGNQPKYLVERESNKHWIRFNKQKQKIREKYPQELFEIPAGYKKKEDYPLEQQKLYREYLKEMGDLIHKKDGWYQKFVWDTISESDKVLKERELRVMSKERKHHY